MKQFFCGVIILLFLCLFNTCPIHNNTQDEEPDYHIPIIWKSDIQRPFAWQITSDETGVYFYSFQKNDFTTVKFNKLDWKTGSTIWSTNYFEEVSLYPPIIEGDYIYATLDDNVILCFDKENGKQLARIRITYNSQDVWITSNYYLYNNYFYFGCGKKISGDIYNFYLARINTDLIMKNGSSAEQLVEPELLWQSRYNDNGGIQSRWYNGRIRSRPFVYNDIAYCNTVTLDLDVPVELAGININTKEEVLYDSFGVNGSDILDHGWEKNPFYEKDGILYYLSRSIAAYDIKNHQKLYHIMFPLGTPKEKYYGAGGFLDVTFYNNKIYYTTQGTNYLGDTGSRNIFCISEKDGKQVWSDIPKRSEALGGKPIIYDNKMFVPHMNGVRVYDADNGKLLGVEKSIEGAGVCFNQLNGSTMITSMLSDEYPNGQLIALDLEK